MRRLLRLLAIVALTAIVAVAGALLLAVQGTPLVATPGAVSVDDVQRARTLMAQHDPRRVPDGTANVVALTQQDVTLLTQYAASRWRRAVTRVTLRDGHADVQVSVDLDGNPLGRWLNIAATVANADGLPEAQQLRVGRLPVPDFAARWVTDLLLARLGSDVPVSLAQEMVHAVTFTPTSVRIDYSWQKDATTRVRNMLIAPEDLERLHAANDDLARLVLAQGGNGPLPLVTLLVPMFQLAAERSAGGDAVAEHRAVLATLTLYVTGRSLSRWVRRASRWTQVPKRDVTLAGREDLAKHFLVSALVSSQNGGTLADAVGRTKEVDDSKFGTGFSFVDLAADRAGTLFGELATGSPARLQEAVTRGLSEADLMPSVADLPESMTAAQFAERFGAIGAPRYQVMMQRIESRLATLPLHRP
jgi:hypothetical protein